METMNREHVGGRLDVKRLVAVTTDVLFFLKKNLVKRVLSEKYRNPTMAGQIQTSVGQFELCFVL